MLSLKYSHLPEYLHHGQFYRGLSADDAENGIEIPADCFRPERDNVANIGEFTQLLRTFSFWILDEVPFGILEYCYQNNVELWQDALQGFPDREIANTLKEVFPNFHEINFEAVVRSNRPDILAFTVQHAKLEQKASQLYTYNAARFGNLLALKQLHESGFVLHEACARVAAEQNNLACLQYAHANGCKFDKFKYINAAQGGHLDCIKYAHGHGLEWDSRVTRAIAAAGHLACLQYVLTQGCPVPPDACNAAASYGHLHCLKLLRQYDAPWDETTSCCAASCSDTSILQYLHENGCPRNSNCPRIACSHGRLSTLRYLLDNGCPYRDDIVVDAACTKNNIHCLRYLIEERSIDISSDAHRHLFIVTLIAGSVECLTYVLDHGCEYLTKPFGDESEWEQFPYNLFYDFASADFMRCVELAESRGWVANENVYKFKKNWERFVAVKVW